MAFVTRNRFLIALLLTIIFSILLWKTSIINLFLQKEGFLYSDSPKIFIINMDKDKDRYKKIIKHYQNSATFAIDSDRLLLPAPAILV